MNRGKPVAIDVFSGAGGLSIGVERAGFRIILANEIEKDFADTYALNHPEAKMLNSDIHEISFRDEIDLMGFNSGEIDLFCGGPPCQGFSTVGSKNRQDKRNSLFYEFLRGVSELEPKFVLFENVSGFKKMYDGFAFKTLIGELDQLGYETISSILEASDYGLPQKRQRTIIVGWKRGVVDGVRFPEKTHFEEVDLFSLKKKLSLMDAISDLPSLGVDDSKESYLCTPKNEYQSFLRGNQDKLTEHNSSKYGEKMQLILKTVPQGGSVLDLPQELRPKKYFNNTYARLIPDQPSPTITRNFGTPSSSRCIHPFQNRALSTREGARLQGFSDAYRFVGSKTSKNLQIGNAVPPIFSQIIAEEIIKNLY